MLMFRSGASTCGTLCGHSRQPPKQRANHNHRPGGQSQAYLTHLQGRLLINLPGLNTIRKWVRQPEYSGENCRRRAARSSDGTTSGCGSTHSTFPIASISTTAAPPKIRKPSGVCLPMQASARYRPIRLPSSRTGWGVHAPLERRYDCNT